LIRSRTQRVHKKRLGRIKSQRKMSGIAKKNIKTKF